MSLIGSARMAVGSWMKSTAMCWDGLSRSGVRLGYPREGLVFGPGIVKRSRNHEVETLEALADPGDHARLEFKHADSDRSAQGTIDRCVVSPTSPSQGLSGEPCSPGRGSVQGEQDRSGAHRHRSYRGSRTRVRL